MEDTVFTVFEQQPYSFLEIKRGTIAGDVIESITEATGVFKIRSGMNISDGQETQNADATLHIKPEESFVSTGLIGHGISHNNKTYEIIGSTGGMNFDNGVMEHYRVTLQAREFSDMSGSS